MQSKASLLIEKENIVLKSIDAYESEKYRELRNREDNRKYFFSDALILREDQEKWYQQYELKNTDYMFSIYLKETNDYLGGIAIYNIDYENKEAEVGRIIVDRFQAKGNGYGSEALTGIVSWGRKELGMVRFYASIYADNYASIKTFANCGFKTYMSSESNSVIYMEKVW